MGKSEMECPGELWVETPGQPGRPDERKLSMLSTLRTFLHGFLYRPQELFASLGSLIDVLHPLHAGPSSQSPVRVSICAARTLNPTGQSRVTLSLRQERSSAAC